MMKTIYDKLSPTEQDEVRSTAVHILNDPMWDAVFRVVREHHVDTLMGEPTYSLTAVHSHASLAVLEEIRSQIALAAAAKTVLRRR